ncbi:hypothetical protein PAI11_14800 [Patulibacter medicamentivorans]|uniref:DUF1653 domain-containing protein n=1 Tax=Patulibacter medicamentivorans TaxID=1097667 RepID=H0E3V5_9ACTN|nr:DUF1653 domain-containing protein [Patulibacter medicamentivorans]EHN11636.1 hypothetical protein PAI11_14800 [Patulibacter medicamentivorans]
MSPDRPITPGRYRHYKGPEYQVLFEARHSETEEPLVVYRALYGERGLWVRPKAMFGETVDVDGVSRPRFALVEADHGPSPSTS